MGRNTYRMDDGRTLEYGFDRVPTPGYFAQVFDPSSEHPGVPVDGGDTRKACAIPPERHMTRQELADFMEKHGAPTHIANVVRRGDHHEL